jgi:trimethylamine-N-oxide reductase (cytochrome c)
MAADGRRRTATRADKTVIKSLGQCSFALNGEPSSVDVADGRILRIRPFHYDEKYSKEELGPWRIEKDGKAFEPLLKSQVPAYHIAYKKRVYSPNRIQYPLKRVDWDPQGAPGSTGPGGRNTQNRGKSKYERISWDEATDIISGEIRRIQKEYGPLAVLAHGDGHGETKTVHGPHGCHMLLLAEAGGYTQAVRNADSWEGWYWGAEHVWGGGGGRENGLMIPPDNVFNDVVQHTEMLLHMGSDLETTPWGFSGQFPSGALYYLTGIGKKQIFVSPDLNYSAAIHADKWIPILPNTDAALQLAIAYIWITEGTYDKEYVATHTVGFDRFSDYVLGKEDGIPKTAKWASAKCGIPVWTIKALAREWGAKVTSTVHLYGGSMIRGPYAHEPARLEVCLLAMQGVGKPGVHQWAKMGGLDLPSPIQVLAGDGSLGTKEKAAARWTGYKMMQLAPQIIPKTLLHQAILDPPVSSWGSTLLCINTEDQFKKYTYPIPKEEGGTEIHMIWMDNPCRTTCWNNGNQSVEAFRSPKIETFVVQHPWLENDTVFADLILPINTKLEEEDLGMVYRLTATPYTGAFLEDPAIEPVGESLSDYEAVGEVAKKLGLYQEYTHGLTVKEMVKACFENESVSSLVTWEQLREKGYYVLPTSPDWEKVPPGLRLFYEDPEKYPLTTPTGKIEFYSQKLADSFPGDEERPPSPQWIEKGPSHDERLSSERAAQYPLLLITNHPRWRTHAQNDDLAWLREIPTCKVKCPDGYLYEPVWVHPSEAAKRGIVSGDIVKLYNERGTVLGGAIVWERLMPGAVYQDHGARADMIATGPDEYIDRGGANNLISPANGTSQNCWGMATSGFLVELAKVTKAQMEEWKAKYPEAFARDYDPAAGLKFDAWIEG